MTVSTNPPRKKQLGLFVRTTLSSAWCCGCLCGQCHQQRRTHGQQNGEGKLPGGGGVSGQDTPPTAPRPSSGLMPAAAGHEEEEEDHENSSAGGRMLDEWLQGLATPDSSSALSPRQEQDREDLLGDVAPAARTSGGVVHPRGGRTLMPVNVGATTAMAAATACAAWTRTQECSSSASVEELLLQAADPEERCFAVQTGAGMKTLVVLLVEAFGMLGITTSRELTEQVQRDSGRNGEFRVDLLLDDVLHALQGNLSQAHLEADEAALMQAVAQGLLLKTMRRSVAVRSPQPDGDMGCERCSLPCVFQTTCPRSGGVAAVAAVACCAGRPRAADSDDYVCHADDAGYSLNDADIMLEHAMQVLVDKTPELAQLQGAPPVTPRTLQAVSPQYAEALRYATETVAKASSSACADEAASTPSHSRDQVLRRL